ncbi:hypothetical protein F2A31_14150 [Acinetobacter suaedae]|uniref:Uncharacterized protein n=1 Tax=Acinetobacter suaedae TaxID=2609668 RepID=A0A5P1UUX7_9GAMM|nr:hypothetical protein [Acinetobacter sp. C16S1]QER40779.1 hypothetical protein F2A31_14150 [Acinetobacter sp. C16S1]
MRRFLIFLFIITVCIGSFFFYQDYIKQRQLNNQKMFDVVMTEKMRELYDQAQDWSTPVEFDVHDDRLSGDYQKMSVFLLDYWMQNVEARNHYLRELKAAKWDTFLDVERLDRDRTVDYKETTQMFVDVRQASAQYEQQRLQIHLNALEQVKKMSIQQDLRQSLQAKLEANLEINPDEDIFAIEQEIIERAQAMFDLLKAHTWQRKNRMILFHENAPVKKFNVLYQEVLKLNSQMNKIKKNNVEVLEEEL